MSVWLSARRLPGDKRTTGLAPDVPIIRALPDCTTAIERMERDWREREELESLGAMPEAAEREAEAAERDAQRKTLIQARLDLVEGSYR